MGKLFQQKFALGRLVCSLHINPKIL